jgi:hypothetical protein
LRRHYLFRDSERIDYRKPQEYGHFGYAALHVIGEPIEVKPTQIYYSDCAFEVQIRSALMDVWGVFNWGTAYTEEKDIPYDVLRRMSTLSALLYLVDEEFIRIRGEIGRQEAAISISKSEVTKLSQKLRLALERRNISLDRKDYERLGEYQQKAEDYFSKDGSLQDYISVDALALYLLDGERFAWLINEEVTLKISRVDRV